MMRVLDGKGNLVSAAVIPSEVEGSREVTFKLVQRDNNSVIPNRADDEGSPDRNVSSRPMRDPSVEPDWHYLRGSG